MEVVPTRGNGVVGKELVTGVVDDFKGDVQEPFLLVEIPHRARKVLGALYIFVGVCCAVIRR
jgi:hypothetical protein